jgi:hypothetical protein
VELFSYLVADGMIGLTKETRMRKFVLAAATAVGLSAAPTFAEGLQSQAANIEAGGQALPMGVIPHGE